MPALMSIFGNLFQGASGSQGTASVFQLAQANQIAQQAEANQRTILYVGGGLLAALAIGATIYYVVK